MTVNIEKYTYNVAWSREDDAYVARVAEFPSLAAHGATLSKALQEIQFVVREVVKDLEECGEQVPEPLGEKAFSGRFNVRLSPNLHRRLAMEASQQGVSLNQIVVQRLSSV